MSTRFKTVMGSTFYAGREALAQRLLETRLPADEILEVLASTSAENATAKQAMELLAAENPDVQPDSYAGTQAANMTAEQKVMADAVASARALNAARKAAAAR